MYTLFPTRTHIICARACVCWVNHTNSIPGTSSTVAYADPPAHARASDGGGEAGAAGQAEDLRMAVDSMGSIYGAVDVEEVLDVVFRDFCIGK